MAAIYAMDIQLKQLFLLTNPSCVPQLILVLQKVTRPICNGTKAKTIVPSENKLCYC